MKDPGRQAEKWAFVRVGAHDHNPWRAFFGIAQIIAAGGRLELGWLDPDRPGQPRKPAKPDWQQSVDALADLTRLFDVRLQVGCVKALLGAQHAYELRQRARETGRTHCAFHRATDPGHFALAYGKNLIR